MRRHQRHLCCRDSKAALGHNVWTSVQVVSGEALRHGGSPPQDVPALRRPAVRVQAGRAEGLRSVDAHNLEASSQTGASDATQLLPSPSNKARLLLEMDAAPHYWCACVQLWLGQRHDVNRRLVSR